MGTRQRQRCPLAVVRQKVRGALSSSRRKLTVYATRYWTVTRASPMIKSLANLSVPISTDQIAPRSAYPRVPTPHAEKRSSYSDAACAICNSAENALRGTYAYVAQVITNLSPTYSEGPRAPNAVAERPSTWRGQVAGPGELTRHRASRDVGLINADRARAKYRVRDTPRLDAHANITIDRLTCR